ncbi:cytochrome P450 [Pararhodobacter oceanensis]|uniref:Cytochrome P450 n=1 Tax=Pararhodobacter oceanensis TaxID=2172121 RepID=A0A2T8HPN2_9RHOB|nr:cytochrome P450 [Pararhodobacter oceanensis]PVH27408.1 cytochrome P450 [Pararhodobacter oceanensis]
MTNPTNPARGAVSSSARLFDTENLINPYPLYQELRDAGPVIWLEAYGLYMLPRYAETKQALEDWESFSSAGGVTMNDEMNEKLRGGLLCSDPPRHDALRKVIERPVTPKALSQLRNRVAEEAKELVIRLVEQGSFDAATELAQHLPVTIVSDLVGLPEKGRERMLAWAPANFDCFGPANSDRTKAAMPIVGEMVNYAFTQCVPGKLKPDGWAQMIWDAAERGEVSVEDAPFMMNDYMGPSLDTTIFATTWLVWLFAKHPDQWQKLRDNPALIPSAINEAVRLHSPIQNFSRYVAKDVEIGGVTLPAGSRVIIAYGSANRDERKWDNPTEFDILRRDSNDHLGFGHGEHNCVGKNLARLEIRALLTELLPRVERFELLEAQIFHNNILHGLQSCRVTVH